jgi:hypothetical protein
MEWLRQSSAADGFVNLSDWLRHLAIERGQTKLGTPWPQRKPLSPARKKSR